MVNESYFEVTLSKCFLLTMNRMVTNLHFDRKKVFMDYEISWTTRFINNHLDFGVRDTTVYKRI